MRSCRRYEGVTAVFIDFANAYNTVQRNTLYEILQRRKILAPDEVLFLRCLHERLFFEYEEEEAEAENARAAGGECSC